MGDLLETLGQWSNLDANSGWSAVSLPILGFYSGQTIRLAIESSNDAAFATSFFLDSLSLRGAALIEFETVLALDGDTFGWEVATDFDWIAGDLATVGDYEVELSGSVAAANTFDIPVGVESLYFLFRRSECGTWGAADRDTALPCPIPLISVGVVSAFEDVDAK